MDLGKSRGKTKNIGCVYVFTHTTVCFTVLLKEKDPSVLRCQQLREVKTQKSAVGRDIHHILIDLTGFEERGFCLFPF